MLGAAQGLLCREPSPHFPDGETEALSGQGHSPRSHSKEGADANPEMPRSCHPLAVQPGPQIIQCRIGSMRGPHTDLQTLGFSVVSMSGPQSRLRELMRHSLLLTGVTEESNGWFHAGHEWDTWP